MPLSPVLLHIRHSLLEARIGEYTDWVGEVRGWRREMDGRDADIVEENESVDWTLLQGSVILVSTFYIILFPISHKGERHQGEGELHLRCTHHVAVFLLLIVLERDDAE
jgi:hypothetical protein